jgi:hypothetical protein
MNRNSIPRYNDTKVKGSGREKHLCLEQVVGTKATSLKGIQ